MPCISSFVGHETNYLIFWKTHQVNSIKRSNCLKYFFNHWYFMTVAYSSETPDYPFEDKLQSRKIRIDCFLQTATKIPLLWVFKIKAETQVSNN